MLLHEMDLAGVDKAVLVCARIEHNPNNNDYGAECVRRYPDRFIQFADVDCSWSDTYHTPGGAGRLAEAVEKYRLKGFTHYLKSDTGLVRVEGGPRVLREGGRTQPDCVPGSESGLDARAAETRAAVPGHALSLPSHGQSEGGRTAAPPHAPRGPGVGGRAQYPHQAVRLPVRFGDRLGISLFGLHVDRPQALRVLRGRPPLLGVQLSARRPGRVPTSTRSKPFEPTVPSSRGRTWTSSWAATWSGCWRAPGEAHVVWPPVQTPNLQTNPKFPYRPRTPAGVIRNGEACPAREEQPTPAGPSSAPLLVSSASAS